MANVTIDLYEDWKAIVIENLQKSGYTVDVGKDVSELTFQYYNALKRAIDIRPRTVFEAENFSCPREHSSSLMLLKSRIESGENLNPYLSTNLRNLDYNDAMLNDWGIYHFHLGQNLRSDGFIERTGPLLFTLVTETSARFIGIYRHGDWSRKAIFEVLHKNWPELLNKFKLDGVLELAYDFNDDELAKLRKAGITTFAQTQDSTVYAPPGGGLVTSGQSLEVRGKVNDTLKLLNSIEKWVGENTDSMIEMAQTQNIEMNYPLNFRLLIEGDKIGVLETGSRMFFFGWQ